MLTSPDITGMQFGEWSVIRNAGRVDKWHNVLYECQCSCGKIKEVTVYKLRHGLSKSCGHTRRVRGGIIATPTGSSWQAMNQRCFNEKHNSYSRYGAIGIVPCEFLRLSPVNIVSIIGERPPSKTLDRIDNKLGYHCGICAECISKGLSLNIKWSTRAEQQNNRRNSAPVTIGGVTKPTSEWAKEMRVSRHTIRRHFLGTQS